MTEPAFDVEGMFDEDYLYFYAGPLDARGDAEAELICRLLRVEPGMEVLDLACGHGRIANALAARGCRVSGLDTTRVFLDRARHDATARGVWDRGPGGAPGSHAPGQTTSLEDRSWLRQPLWFALASRAMCAQNRAPIKPLVTPKERKVRRSRRPWAHKTVDNANAHIFKDAPNINNGTTGFSVTYRYR